MDQSTGLPIAVAKTGFYAEYNKIVAFHYFGFDVMGGCNPFFDARGGDLSL